MHSSGPNVCHVPALLHCISLDCLTIRNLCITHGRLRARHGHGQRQQSDGQQKQTRRPGDDTATAACRRRRLHRCCRHVRVHGGDVFVCGASKDSNAGTAAAEAVSECVCV